MGVAAILDHRYKIELLEYYYVKLYENDANDQVKSIRQLCYDLLYEYQLKMNNCSSSDSQMLDVHFSNVEDDGLEYYDLYVIKKKKRARTSFVKTELDIYLEEEVLPRNPDFDILLWWKLNGVKYPTLQTIAKDILAILVSTVASESAFSTGGHILSPHQSRFHWTTLEALMCARSELLTSGVTSLSNSHLEDDR
ncbi:zinc finger BED domain-containing protein DAYSLEEPER-like [Cicer arietinum]|uniref:zinc finger BED domain-containing protein DAYSLEEPER-like n=1 Tax=Cicer arietinum TaxID=3827 RepID=UPI003CC68CEC